MANSIGTDVYRHRAGWTEGVDDVPPPAGPPAHDGTSADAYARYERFAQAAWAATPTCDFEHEPTEEIASPTLFARGSGDATEISVHDVKQGKLGDCALMAVLAALAAQPWGRALIKNAITENRDPSGRVASHTVTLYAQERRWPWSSPRFVEKRVTVDTKYVRDHAHPRKDGDDNVVWPLVVEHAYAAYAGGYNAMGCGRAPSDVMRALLGREPHSRGLAGDSPYTEGDLLRDVQAGAIIVMSTKRGIDTRTSDLVDNHAYSVTKSFYEGGKLLVALHDPLGDDPDPPLLHFDELSQWFDGVDVASPGGPERR